MGGGCLVLGESSKSEKAFLVPVEGVPRNKEQETSRNVPVPSVTTFRQSFWDTIRLEAIATRFPFKLIRHLSSVCIYIYIYVQIYFLPVEAGCEKCQ